ncbi:MAG: cysteine hydrolase [Thaumarchaeota archaeon]|nr:cysteine hydrolase [Nitrososphaerota archaeon]
METESEWSFEELIDPKHTALIVIDMQNDYCSRKGSLCQRGSDVSMVEEMAPKLVHLLTYCRENGILIIHTRNIHSEYTDTDAWKRRGGPKAMSKVARRGSWGAEWFEEHPEFTPRTGEYIVDKHRYSAFIGTDLEIVLKAKNIKTLVITGTATNVCVESTARHGAMLDFHIIFLKDCTATYSKVLQESTETNMKNHFGTLATSGELIAMWTRSPDTKVGKAAPTVVS